MHMHDESLILVLPPPTGIAHNSAIQLHVYCATYDPPRPPLAYAVCHTLYNIGNAISCKKGQRVESWSQGGRMPGRDVHGQGRMTPGERHGCGASAHWSAGGCRRRGCATCSGSVFGGFG